MRSISIFGATGSVGQGAVGLIRGAPPDRYRVVALTGGRNIDLLAQNARELGAELAVTAHEELHEPLRARLSGSGTETAAGAAAVAEAACRRADWFMSAIVGAAGLEPGLRALQHGTTLALANKESLIMAGTLMMETARNAGATIIPVDSEHSAIFQALRGEDVSTVERVIITASGGAFRDFPLNELPDVSVAAASSHPNWNMGQRITIDSASMFNKAMELVETREYFGFSPDQIEVLLHPQSLIHAIVGFRDGGMIAHAGPPDMRHAISYALHWPEREDCPVERLDFAQIGVLEFQAPDPERYPALELARAVMDEGGLAGAIFNAAKETALDCFIARRIRFTDMAKIVRDTMNALFPDRGLVHAGMSRDNIRAADRVARATAEEIAGQSYG